MNLNVSLVPNGHVHNVYPYLIEYIHKAVEWALGRMDADDISATLFRKDVQTWVVFDTDTNEVHGFLTSEIRIYPQSKHFCVLNCGGRDGSLEACVHTVFDLFDKYAIDNGCDGMEIIGRPAWSRFIKEHGYTKPYMQYFKSLRG